MSTIFTVLAWGPSSPSSRTQCTPVPIPKRSKSANTVIPIHYHPCDEYVYVLKGIIETGGRECTSGTFWFTPANTKNGPHKAITDVEIITIRLGAMGVFEEASI
ncbi:hypothetical protein B4U84_07815 [Westiellopsis prolifica IICB1]|nr:hypothetical protein B4U84_07815 [Westiellopsis prolifica IICB1]